MLSNQKERLTFDQIPQLVSDLKDQISDLAQQVAALTSQQPPSESRKTTG